MLLFICSISSGLSVNAGLLEALNKKYPQKIFSSKGLLSNQTIELLPGVPVELHSDDYWNKDFTNLVREQLINYVSYFYNCNKIVIKEPIDNLLLRGRLLLLEVMGQNLVFSDDVVYSFIHKLIRSFGIKYFL